MTSTLPKFFELSQALNQTTLKLHPSQAHGLICGILCGNSPGSAPWQDLITGEKSTRLTHDLLQNLYDISTRVLESYLVEFQLILPEDSCELPARAEALTLWCQCFLTGLKLVDIPIVDREPGETTEAIDDIIEIANMNYEEVVPSEEDEVAYVELVEFIRIAVILIYQHTHENELPANQSSSSVSFH